MKAHFHGFVPTVLVGIFVLTTLSSCGTADIDSGLPDDVSVSENAVEQQLAAKPEVPEEKTNIEIDGIGYAPD